VPREIPDKILSSLDLQSLWSFARASRGAYQIVNGHYQYRELRRHAAYVIAALFRTRLAREHSIARLYAALKGTECATCKHFGAYLWLLSAERACYQCMLEKPAYSFVLPSSVAGANLCWRDKKDREKLRMFYPVPGEYGPSKERRIKEGTALISAAEAFVLSKKLGEPGGRWFEPGRMVQEIEDRMWESILAESWYFRTRGLEPFALFAVPFPSLNSDGTPREVGWCVGCNILYSWHYGKGKEYERYLLDDLEPQERERIEQGDTISFMMHADTQISAVKVVKGYGEAARRAWLREELVKRHLGECDGAKLVRTRIQKGKWEGRPWWVVVPFGGF